MEKLKGITFLLENNSLNYAVFWQPISFSSDENKIYENLMVIGEDKKYFAGIVRPDEKYLDGHSLIFIESFRERELIGIGDREQNLSDRVYKCAKRCAKEIMGVHYILIDYTTRGNKKSNRQEMKRLQKSLLEQRLKYEKEIAKTDENLKRLSLIRGPGIFGINSVD